MTDIRDEVEQILADWLDLGRAQQDVDDLLAALAAQRLTVVREGELPREALEEVLASTVYERGSPHGYACRVCGEETTAPPFGLVHDPECEAQVVRTWLARPEGQ